MKKTEKPERVREKLIKRHREGEGGKEDRKTEERHSGRREQQIQRKEGRVGESRKGRKERGGRKGWTMEGKEDE